MTIESVILSVCEEMVEDLSPEQMTRLKDVLFMKFHGIQIKEECTSVQTAMDEEEEKLIDYFKASKAISGRQLSTIEQYVHEINFLRQATGKKLTEITSMDLRWYFGICRTQRGNSMTTIQNRRGFLNSFYSFLLKEGVINVNPVERIEPMKAEQRLKKAYSTEELEKLRGACGTNFRNRALMEFLLSTGARVSEVCALNVRDIDLGRLEFSVIGKGNKQRRCYINETGCFYLMRYLDWRMEKEGISKAELMEKPLFVSERAPFERISKRGIQKTLAAMGKEAGVSNVHPHRFRRTYASTLAARGCPIQDLRVLMGHSNVDTTLIYCDIKQENVNLSYRKYGKEA